MAFSSNRGADSKKKSTESAPRVLSPEKQEARARNVLLFQLSKGAKSTKQLREILEKREIDRPIADAIIERFIEVGLIDDRAFAQTLVSSRSKFRGLSISAIRRELAQKGVDQQIIDEALVELTADSELAKAFELATRRIRQMSHLEPDVRQRRLAGYLGRKGYPSATVFAAVKNAEQAIKLEV